MKKESFQKAQVLNNRINHMDDVIREIEITKNLNFSTKCIPIPQEAVEETELLKDHIIEYLKSRKQKHLNAFNLLK